MASRGRASSAHVWTEEPTGTSTRGEIIACARHPPCAQTGKAGEVAVRVPSRDAVHHRLQDHVGVGRHGGGREGRRNLILACTPRKTGVDEGGICIDYRLIALVMSFPATWLLRRDQPGATSRWRHCSGIPSFHSSISASSKKRETRSLMSPKY